jgi:hypothetical protein
MSSTNQYDDGEFQDPIEENSEDQDNEREMLDIQSCSQPAKVQNLQYTASSISTIDNNNNNDNNDGNISIT